MPYLPGLWINNYGYVQLPVNDQSAQKLITVFKRAFDYQTFQLDQSSFHIKNSVWERGLAKLVDRIAEGLGCTRKAESSIE